MTELSYRTIKSIKPEFILILGNYFGIYLMNNFFNLEFILENFLFPIVVGIITYFIPSIYNYLKNKRDLQKRNSIVYFDLKGYYNSEAKFFCQPYQKNKKRGKYGDWYSPIGPPIELNLIGDKRWGIEAEIIKGTLRNDQDPFKCYCEIPVENKNQIYSLLCNSGHTVTGMGKKSDDESKWQIWFLIGHEKYHKNIQDISRINNKL